MGMHQKTRRFLTHLISKGAILFKSSHETGAKIAYIPPEAVAIEVLFGGSSAPVIASAATCIGASQPFARLYVELSGAIGLVAAPSVSIDEAVPPSETQAPSVISCASVPVSETSSVYTKLSEELTPA